MGIESKNQIFRYDYLGYPLWSDRYNCWVMAAEHPSFLMRGQHSRVPILQFIFKRALEIAEQGLKLDDSKYLEDPAPERFLEWVKACLHYLHENTEAILSYDIETPHKQGQDEEEAAKEDDGDYTILRCSFSYAPGIAVSVPWTAPYIPMIESLFASPHEKCGWNNYQYDDPRIRAQMPINGDLLDGMIMWHVLNSALDKGLGFVTPWYVHNTSMWKHLSDERPAYYNAKDADMALRNVLGIRRDLKANDLWKVYENHVVKLNRALSYMSEMGVLRDEEMRNAAESKLSNILNKITYDMAAVVPDAARRLKIYKKLPKELKGLDGIELEEAAKALNMAQVERSMPVKRCSLCRISNPHKSHFKPASKKQIAAGLDKVCAEAAVITVEEMVKVWAKQLDFKASKLGLSMYQGAVQHRSIVDWKEQKTTFDAKAIVRLVKQYPNDSLYPLILKHREVQKLLGTYIGITQLGGKIKGGMDIAADGRIHTQFSHNPSTLRLASQHPNLQNLPRPKGKDDLATIIRNLIIAGPGQIFLACDYSGIEAVLTGYFALAPNYIRLAKIDVHSYYTAYALHELDGRVSANDLPLVSWDDAKLTSHLAAIKAEFKAERNNLYKHLIHAGNFFQSPKGAAEKIFEETGIEYPVAKVAKIMGIYFDLFPEIRRWHWTLMYQVEKDGYLRNPFGYVHRFFRPFDYKKEGGKWKKEPGQDANRLIAFLPQSTAAGIIKEAILRLYFNRFEEAGQYMRLQIHDEIFCEVPEAEVDRVSPIVREEMEKSIPELRLPASYKMGECLNILTEDKKGYRWGEMK
jgi:DNA polymerase I-like protein with 3'-5' exonuclease and polymerase domains